MKTTVFMRKRDEVIPNHKFALAEAFWGKKSPMTIGKIGGVAGANPTAPKFGVE